MNLLSTYLWLQNLLKLRTLIVTTSFPVVVFILPRQSLTYYMIPRDIKEVAFRTIDHLLVIEDLQLCLPYFTSLRMKK